ncbi:hypothetical protein [Anaeroselena agilis]|uniref:Uncharacterized protein n=1 Tax=Anaeroselena agilis TaxID=3063788 RepID=A0ABU3NVP6_9FIRM|nr:hypothetical protein [Selenomonadales bacterium 4137-cl]
MPNLKIPLKAKTPLLFICYALCITMMVVAFMEVMTKDYGSALFSALGAVGWGWAWPSIIEELSEK